MIDKNVVIGTLFLLWGVISIVKPENILTFRRWTAKKFFGAEYKTTNRTENIQRVMGIAFVIAALIITDII